MNMRKGIHKTLKKIHPELTISAKGMEVMNDLIMDLLCRLSETAGEIMRKPGSKKTMDSYTMMMAVKLMMRGELAKHAVHEGTRAVTRYHMACDHSLE